MGKLITWFDVETVIFQKLFEDQWPEGMVGASVHPNEIQIRIKDEEDRKPVSKALNEWFGHRYDTENPQIYLEFSPNENKRSLAIEFEIEADGVRVIPESLKPNFASISLYPKEIGLNLRGPDFSKIEGQPKLWAFYSFKGGVGRTLHSISLVKALSELESPQKVLIVDADLEAPGITWWAKEQFGNLDISFLDFLTLAHYDKSDDYAETLKITTESLHRQMLVFETEQTKVEHFFLPAFREVDQLMRMPILPENLCWESGKEWLVPELLFKLGKSLGVGAVVVDLRAGFSELSSSFLFDPRVNRFIVTTPSGQSIEGTKCVLEQIKKISHALKEKDSDYEEHLPTVILSMVQEKLKDSTDFESTRELLREYLINENRADESLIGKDVLSETFFDEDLLYLKNLNETQKKLINKPGSIHSLMSKIAVERFTIEDKRAREVDSETTTYKEDLKKLHDIAELYVYAESGKATDFLITQNLKNIARTTPVAVIMGAKGAGKTHTFLQLAHLKEWNNFLNKVGEKPINGYDGLIWPLIIPRNLQENAVQKIEDCRKYIIDKKQGEINFKILTNREVESWIDQEKKKKNSDASSWRDFWFQLMARSLACEEADDPLAMMQKRLTETNTRIIFQIDGLENYFQNTGTDEVEGAAIRALCQSVVEAIREWPDNRIGLLVFVRKDIVRASIKQNFGQFESLYRSLELKWDRDEALRLVAWLIKYAACLGKYVRFGSQIENISGNAIENALEPLWGKKMGPLHSREAYTANWVIAALSDFNAQLQARDLIRLIYYAAKNALALPESPDRLIPPAAIRDALDPCSIKKIEEIQQEITDLEGIFIKLTKIPEKDRESPFHREQFDLTAEDIDIMKTLGIVTEYESKYYFPEIIRRGLGFKLAKPGRLKVLALLKRSIDK
ncbi:MAG: KGGVGR-motif variant AAA ATPase [Candidatus Omnitrophota bacterium]